MGVAWQSGGQLGKRNTAVLQAVCRGRHGRGVCPSPVGCICRRIEPRHEAAATGGIPEQTDFETKPQIALARSARRWSKA